jgi:hypothetical protein
MDIKLSQLPVASFGTPSDFMMIVQNNVNKQITLTSLLNVLDSGNDINLNPSRNPINTNISSANLQNLFFLQGTSDSIGINTKTPQALFHVNGNIKLGLSGNSPLAVSSIGWGAGGIITVTTTLAHGFVTGELILLSGVTPIAYNGGFQITVTGPSTFTYILLGYTSITPGVVAVNGSVSTISSQGNGVILHSDETVFYPSGGTNIIPLNAARDLSVLIVPTGTFTGNFSLGNGVIGQYKTITLSAIPTAGSAVLTTKNFSTALGWNNIKFSAVGQSVYLRCISINGNPTWVCIGSYGVIFSTL